MVIPYVLVHHGDANAILFFKYRKVVIYTLLFKKNEYFDSAEHVTLSKVQYMNHFTIIFFCK